MARKFPVGQNQQHHSNAKSTTHATSYELTSQGHNADINEDHDQRGELMCPKVYSSKRYKILVKLGLLCLIIPLGAGCLVNTGFKITFSLTDTKSFEPNSPDFPLYKNTRFHYCATTTVENANCTKWTNITDIETDPVRIIAPVGKFGYGPDWCDIVYCFKDFKVAPSEPRKSAFRRSGLDNWASISQPALAAILFFWSESFSKSHYQSRCPDKGFFKWNNLISIWTVAAFITWWWNYHTFNTSAKDVQPLSIFAWLTTWRFAKSFHYHPIKCFLYDRVKLRSILLILLYIVSVAHWIASARVFSFEKLNPFIGTAKGLDGGYECLQDQIVAAPGTTKCSPAEICTTNGMFDAKDFDYMRMDMSWSAFHFFAFIFFTMGTVLDSAWAIWNAICFHKGRTEKLVPSPWGIKHTAIFLDSFLGLFGILSLAFGLKETVRDLRLGERVARMAVDHACQVIHVEMSPWRQYYDVDIDRAWRIAKAWLNG